MALSSGTLVLSTTAAQLPAKATTWVNLRNNDGSIAILVGNGSTQSYTIPANGSDTFRVTNQNQLWVKSASATPTCSFISG